MSVPQRNLLVLFGILILTLLAWSCKEKDVLFINDDEELRRFVNESEIGKQLFRKDSLIVADTFRVAANPGFVYKIVVDSVRRQLTLDITSRDTGKWFRNDVLPDPSYKGWRDAEVRVDDTLYLHTFQMSPSDTVITASKTLMKRVGWFVKYGDDNNAYAGWLLFGFNGDFPFSTSVLGAHFYVTAPNNYIARGDSNVDSLAMSRYPYAWEPNKVDTQKAPLRTQYRYEKITDTVAVLKIPGNTTLTLSSDSMVPDYSNYMLVTTPQNNRQTTSPLVRTGSHYDYTFEVPDLPSSWNLLVMQEVRNGTARKIWCIPYRVWP